MPRATREERDARDALILQLFLAGRSYRIIAKVANVNISLAHRIVQREMREAGKRRDYIQENAFDVYVERVEALYAKAYTRATDDKLKIADQLKALETCRRYLDMLGRVQGVSDDAGVAPPPPPADGEDDDEDPEDELAAWRKSHG